MLALVLADSTSHFGWYLGYGIAIGLVVVVVALVVPILVLAHGIGKEAGQINESLQQAVDHTVPLAGLQTTIDSADVIAAGLKRGRTRLGG
jgi:hypothetical protein